MSPREPIPPDPEDADTQEDTHSDPDPNTVDPLSDPTVEERVLLESLLEQYMLREDPWGFLTAIQHEHRVPAQHRQYFLDWFKVMVARKPESERDALLEQGRPVFRYRMETIRREIQALRTDSNTLKIRPTVTGPDFLAEMIYQPTETPCIKYLRYYYATGQIDIVEDLAIGTTTYKPPQTKMAELGVVKLPTGTLDYVDDQAPDAPFTADPTTALLLRVRQFMEDYVYIESEPFRNLAAYYVLLTWIFDRFNVVPYLRAQGEFGVGKTRLLQVIGALAYRGIFAGGATTASPIFRLIDRFHGTLVFDEADFSDRSEIWSEITKILNNGYVRGFPVLRSEKQTTDGNYDAEAFDCYGPKILTTRRRFNDQALESRCLSHTMQLGSVPQHIPLDLGEDFNQRSEALRNQLLLWRCRVYQVVNFDPRERFQGFDSRLNQLLQPLLAVNPQSPLRNEIIEYARRYQHRLREDRRDSIEGRIAKCLLDTYESRSPDAHMCRSPCHERQSHALHREGSTATGAHVYDRMTVVMMRQVNDRVRTEFEDVKVDPRKVSEQLRHAFSLATVSKGGNVYVVISNDDARRIAERYAIALRESTMQEQAPTEAHAAPMSGDNGSRPVRTPVL